MRILNIKFILPLVLLFIAASFNSCKRCFKCTRPLLCATCIDTSGQSSNVQVCNDLYAHDGLFYNKIDEQKQNGYKCEMQISGSFEEEICGAGFGPIRKSLKNSFEKDLNYDCL